MVIKHFCGPTCTDESWKGTLLLIHGIDGHGEATWKKSNHTASWPEALSTEFDGLAVYSAFLDYRVFTVETGVPERLIENHSEALLKSIEALRLADKPLFFIAHSLGGILLNRMLADSLNLDPNGYFRDRRARVQGAFYLACPHNGSPFAAHPLRYVISPLRPMTITVADLKADSRVVKDVRKRIAGSVIYYPHCKIVTVNETRPILQNLPWWKAGDVVARVFRSIGPVVPVESSRLGLPNELEINVDLDHFDICDLGLEEAAEVRRELKELVSKSLGRTTKLSDIGVTC